MAASVIRVDRNHDDPLDAADEFYAEFLERTNREGADLIVYLFDPAGYEHRAWRLAAIQNAARKLAPARVNGIVGSDEGAVKQALDWLSGSPGITGQLFAVGRD